MYIIIDDDDRPAVGKTLQEAYEYYSNYVEPDHNFNDLTFYEATEINVEREVKIIPTTTVSKVK